MHGTPGSPVAVAVAIAVPLLATPNSPLPAEDCPAPSSPPARSLPTRSDKRTPPLPSSSINISTLSPQRALSPASTPSRSLSPSRSPSPPRSPSPSPSQVPVRRTPIDFEKALLRPNDVLYLSPTPSILEQQSALARRLSRSRSTAGGAGSTATAAAAATTATTTTATTTKTTPTTTLPTTAMDDPARFRQPQSSPARAGSTPHPEEIERRESVVSQDSARSTGRSSNGTSAAQQRMQQRKMILAQTQSLGLDAEIKAEDAAHVPKRRSIFRTAGTASTPDLSTLIRGKKQKAAAAAAAAAAQQAAPPSSSSGMALNPNGKTSAAASSVAVGSHLSSTVSNSTSSLSSNTRRHSDRDAGLQARGGAEWDRANSSQTHLHNYQAEREHQMATISEGPTEHLVARPSQDEGKKRSKGKGMFGRMFGGGSSSKDPYHHGIHGPSIGSTSQLSLAGRSQVDVSSPTSATSPTLPSSPRFPGNQAFSFADANGAANNASSTRPPLPQRPSVPIVPKTASVVEHPVVSPEPAVAPDTVVDFAAAPAQGVSEPQRPAMAPPRTSQANVHEDQQGEEVMVEQPVAGRRPHSSSVSSSTGSIIDPGRAQVQRGDSLDAGTSHSRSASRRATAEGGGAGGSPRGPPGRNASSFSDDVTGLLDRISHGEASAGGIVRGSPAPPVSREPDASEHLRVSPERSSSINSRYQRTYNDRSPTLGMTPRSGGDDALVADPLPVPSNGTDAGTASASSAHSHSPAPVDTPAGETSPVTSEPSAEDEGSDTGVPVISTAVAGVAGVAAVGTAAAAAAATPNVRVSAPRVPPDGPPVPPKRGNTWEKQQQQQQQQPDPSASASSVRLDTDSLAAMETTSSAGQSNVNLADIGDTDEEKGRQLAVEFYEGDATHVPTDKVAIFIGGQKPINVIALYYYMQYFDMRSLRLDQAFRDLCTKLHLKAESQEIDRILEAFSTRYYECNPNTVFGTPGVVHTVTAAMLMLNTDLHIAELSKHMSRADFVRNAMRAIHESMPDRDSSTIDLTNNDSGSLRNVDTLSATQSTTSVRLRAPSTQRNASGTLSPPVSELTSPSLQDLRSRASSTTISSSFTYSKAWEQDAETALKDIFANVRNDRILLPMASMSESDRQSTTSLGGLSRVSGLGAAAAALGVKRGKGNSPYNNTFSSDGRLSPNASHPNSIGEVLAPALGFAGNLSHTVIKEQDDEAHSIRSQDSSNTIEEMSVDDLALLGAPWAKEGLLQRKVQVEAQGKKMQKKDWKQFFVVIQKGDLHMFVFGSGGGMSSGGGFGGGNWMSSANRTGEYSLMHAMAMALPKPGYSAVRPYCFTVTFPTGEISVFQAGTEELVAEWVATCNYWAARRSRQPLVGGVSNMEYGWARVLSNTEEDPEDRSSVMSSTRMRGAYNRVRGQTSDKKDMDKTHINEWKPPPHATIASTLDEEAQLESLVNYVNSLMEELNQHKAVEEPMTRLYASGSKNGVKARENWTAKSRYIHSEIFKYETYVEALRNAIQLRVQKQEERRDEQRAEKKKARAAAAAAAAAANGQDVVG